MNTVNSFDLQKEILLGRPAGVRKLLASGVVKPATAHAAVHIAARHGRADILPLLLAAGGQLYYTGGHDLEVAIQRGFPDVVRLMLAHLKPTASAGKKGLRAAVLFGRPEMVTWLREAGVPVPLGKAAGIQDLEQARIDVQRALVASGGKLSGKALVALTRKGLAPEALYAALARRPTNADLLAVLQATRALDDLSPAERADLLEDMLNRSPHRARQASAVAAPR